MPTGDITFEEEQQQGTQQGRAPAMAQGGLRESSLWFASCKLARFAASVCTVARTER